jgi:hypothetical protein
VARQGKGMDPNAGSRQLDPVFAQTAFRLDFLTRPNAFSDMGFDFGKVRSGTALPALHGPAAFPDRSCASGACLSTPERMLLNARPSRGHVQAPLLALACGS